MYLKEIDLYGFKSFADKTSIVFSPNINGIVGPNGSGKSNILDAVKFVLGEQSSKNLRGDGSINDVIFSGSKSRKPLSSASVTLIFDNTDNSLPINFPEVSIKRMVYKSGENEYFINGERCRLKDITDLMLDTSSSKESFNIIGQGKISQIISSKPVDRRGVFEEAAGVLKYKKRKEEAIRKLEKTNDNLIRVNDIINEFMANLKPLEVQSRDAKRYLSLKDNLSNLEISLMVFDIEKLNFNYKESKRQIDLINDELLSMNSSSSISDTSILENKDKLKKIDEEINEKQTILLTITSKLENLKSSLKVLQERKKYTKETSLLKDNVDNLSKTLLDIETKINNLNNNIIINEKEYSTLFDSIKSKENSYNELKSKMNKLIDSIARSKREENDILYKIEYLENVVNNNSNLPNSVKNILNNPKFKVHNIIGKLIDMEEKYQLAISTSLGIASSYIVTDNEEEASKCVHYLRDNNLGRATFYPLNIIKPRYIPSNIINSIKDVSGYVDIASNVVKYDKKYENIILNQLGNVIVSTNIECANNIAKKINHAYKIVTIDGNIINVGGSITGGSNIKNNILKEKYEIDNYQNKHRLLVEKIKNEESSLTNYEKELHNYENDLYELRNKNNLINDLISNKREELNKLSDERLSIKNNLDSYNGLLSNKEDLEEAKLYNDITLTTKERDNVLTSINVLKMDKDNVSEIITNLETVTKKNSAYISKKESRDWLGYIAAPIFIFLRMTFLPAGLAAWALYDVYHFNPFLAILIALPGLAWMLIGGAGLAIAGLLERLKKNNRIDHHNQIYVDTSSEKEAFNDNCSKAEMKSNDEVPDSSDKSTLEQSEIHPDIVTCPLENIENNVDTGEAIPTDESRSIYGDIKSTGVERALTLILLMCVLSFVIFCGFNLIHHL